MNPRLMLEYLGELYTEVKVTRFVTNTVTNPHSISRLPTKGRIRGQNSVAGLNHESEQFESDKKVNTFKSVIF